MNIASIQGNMILIDRYYFYKFTKIPDLLNTLSCYLTTS
jgi:hypothetical protein